MKWVRGHGPLLCWGLSQNLSPPAAAISSNWYPGYLLNCEVSDGENRQNELPFCLWKWTHWFCVELLCSCYLGWPREVDQDGIILWGCQTWPLRKASSPHGQKRMIEYECSSYCIHASLLHPHIISPLPISLSHIWLPHYNIINSIKSSVLSEFLSPLTHSTHCLYSNALQPSHPVATKGCYLSLLSL